MDEKGNVLGYGENYRDFPVAYLFVCGARVMRVCVDIVDVIGLHKLVKITSSKLIDYQSKLTKLN